jgi:hypothetical protein
MEGVIFVKNRIFKVVFWNTFLRQGSHQSVDASVWFVILVSLLDRYGSKSKFTHSLSVNDC